MGRVRGSSLRLLCSCWLGLSLVSAGRAEPAAVPLPEGSPMRDFGLRALDPATGQLGGMVWLSDFVGERAKKPPAELLALSFFAVWCKPCIEELPTLARLQREYRSRGLQVLSVNLRTAGESLDDTLATTRALWRKHDPGFPVLFDRYTNHNQRLYVGERGIVPCHVLIDRKGRIVARYQGGGAEAAAKLEAAVSRALPSRPTEAP
jgi:thiol-disulfide isomerase/thioredoxin